MLMQLILTCTGTRTGCLLQPRVNRYMKVHGAVLFVILSTALASAFTMLQMYIAWQVVIYGF